MVIDNADIAADLLDTKGDDPFRIRAYRNATRTLATLAPGVQTCA